MFRTRVRGKRTRLMNQCPLVLGCQIHAPLNVLSNRVPARNVHINNSSKYDWRFSCRRNLRIGIRPIDALLLWFSCIADKYRRSSHVLSPCTLHNVCTYIVLATNVYRFYKGASYHPLITMSFTEEQPAQCALPNMIYTGTALKVLCDFLNNTRNPGLIPKATLGRKAYFV